VSRIAFLVDGFNLYHSLKKARLALQSQSTLWLDLRALCASYLPHIGRTASLEAVHYFSALAWHLESVKPGVTIRHQVYIECLRASGVTVELSKFKQKDSHCRRCGATMLRHEEKETDVAISVRLLDLLHQGLCDSAVIISGDSDIVPAVRCARRLFPNSPVYACFPYHRESLELRSVAYAAFKITKKAYTRHQFPDPFRLADGREFAKPPGW
jgi:uncharacterized LabA/DUF88 family protein